MIMEKIEKQWCNPPQYVVLKGTLYRKGHTDLWLKRIDGAAGNFALKEPHAGSVGAHEGARALTVKSATYGPLLARNTPRCGRANTDLRGMPNLLANAGSTTIQVNKYT